MKKILLPVIVSFIIVSCKKDIKSVEEIPGAETVQSSQTHPVPKVDYPFFFRANGAFTISPVSASIVSIEQQMSFTSSSPFELIGGYVRGFDDLTIPTFPDRFFGGSLRFFGKGNDSIFGIVTVQTSVFSDPINPQAGDFFGSEDFTGTFQITGGTGRFIHARGSGEYSAHSEWRPPVTVSTLFSGFTVVNGTGLISVVARNGQLESFNNKTY